WAAECAMNSYQVSRPVCSSILESLCHSALSRSFSFTCAAIDHLRRTPPPTAAVPLRSGCIFLFKQKTAYEMLPSLEFRRVLFRSWWRCHRSLIADYLKLRGSMVIHVMDETHTQIHPYTSAARIIHGRLSYEGLLGE